ncbi:phosphoenolpyruvate carboxykinase (ATP) [Iocasia frigidifontis]|uniref:phosphoenolpyruvate carboxykinase (ATP) n=1 Tax=Iocasia fonsfrigidae TaxID=2682810 RepID=A0A8A7KGW1_9FIRM|nr:phosphoenolpyruvate carboxykinase (ATP) [Iocasia fonsfrigidae]QTL98978.1 phosphoenolpyruvate carboxykinase (ATP) [Iocasia fonsfrigidae]
MSTIEYFETKDIISRIRTTVETAFYGNNVEKLLTPAEAYKKAKNSPGTIETGMPIYKPEEIGLPQDANILLFNDGAVKGRCAAARRIVGEPEVDLEDYAAKIREAVYDTRYRKMYHCQAYVGLDKDFMIKAHLLMPENHENIAYSWLLNFQYINELYNKMYKESQKLPNEGDIYIFSDPDWTHPDHPLGLTFFDPEHNVAALLGMRYFGEHKKGTLTLGWGTANRHNFACCHGGLKRYNLNDNSKYVVAVFGLSGSGKSTITHAKHGGKYDVTILHDDAFIINVDDGSSVALEPSYFDKTQDYPMGDEDNKYILTAQNTGATVDEDGNVVLVTEDIRNGNGRAVKSVLWSPNRVNKIDEKADAVFWLMKDPTLPPVLKLNGTSLASAMGATLATKRTSAERLAEGVDPNALVVEPYANPFRTYPLEQDYNKFKALFDTGIECYILNTGAFMGKDITPPVTLGVIESIIEGKAEFKQWENFSDIEIMEIDGYVPDFSDTDYKKQFTARMNDRIEYIKGRETERGGFDKLPADALKAIQKVVEEI